MRCVIALFVLLTCFHVQAQEDLSERHRINQLIEQLGNDEFSQRQAASEGLRSIGRPALPQLFEATKGDDPEVAIRAYWLYARIESAELVRPTLVSLTGKGLSARAVFEEISLQAATPMHFCETGEEHFQDELIDVDFDKVPYWEAFLQTCHLSGNTCFHEHSAPTLYLRKGTQGLERYAPAGPVLLKLRSAERQMCRFTTPGFGGAQIRPCLYVDYYVFCEGKIPSRQCGSATVHRCLTDKGEVEMFASPHQYTFNVSRPRIGELSWVVSTATVLFPPENLTVIQELTGELPVLLSLELPSLPEFRAYQTWVSLPFTLRNIPLPTP